MRFDNDPVRTYANIVYNLQRQYKRSWLPPPIPHPHVPTGPGLCTLARRRSNHYKSKASDGFIVAS